MLRDGALVVVGAAALAQASSAVTLLSVATNRASGKYCLAITER